MSKILIILIIFFTYSNNYGQDYKKIISKQKHNSKILSIATNNDFFASCSHDKITVWNYEGKIIYKYKLIEGRINSMSFIQDTSELLVGITEKDRKREKRFLIKCFDISGDIKYELIDTTLTQGFVDDYCKKNSHGALNAINHLRTSYPKLDIRNSGIPQVESGLSHIEVVHDITVSPTKRSIATIDLYNFLKIWDTNGKLYKSLQIKNNKKDTEVYYLSDSIILITPNIVLNTNNLNAEVIKGFEKYSSIPFADKIYFYFDYNNESKPEKLYDIKTFETKELDSNEFYTLYASRSHNKLALLGVDGLIRVINKKGVLISSFGKSKNRSTSFRGEKIKRYSNICKIGFSPNSQYIISGDEYGKICIWKNE